MFTTSEIVNLFRDRHGKVSFNALSREQLILLSLVGRDTELMNDPSLGYGDLVHEVAGAVAWSITDKNSEAWEGSESWNAMIEKFYPVYGFTVDGTMTEEGMKVVLELLKELYDGILINLTPHDIHIVDKKGVVIKTIPPSGMVARLDAETIRTGDGVDEVFFSRTKFGEVTMVETSSKISSPGLPKQIHGRYFIVSQLIKSAFPGRGDLLVPAEVVRDAAGRIIGCESLGI